MKRCAVPEEFTLELLDQLLEEAKKSWDDYAGTPAHYRAIVEQIAALAPLKQVTVLQLSVIVHSAVQCVEADKAKALPPSN